MQGGEQRCNVKSVDSEISQFARWNNHVVKNGCSSAPFGSCFDGGSLWRKNSDAGAVVLDLCPGVAILYHFEANKLDS